MDIDIKEVYKSHPNKLLYSHLNGVAKKARKHWDSKIVEFIAFFHDLGKINPNFQKKLNGQNAEYSKHSHLSAIAWMIFCVKNPEMVMNCGELKKENVYAISAIISKHHGDLPDLEKGFFSQSSSDEINNFLSFNTKIPISKFLQNLIIHKEFSFEMSDSEADYYFNKTQTLYYTKIKNKINDPLKFFHDTQFGFACLIEADKRDAGNNDVYQREILGCILREKYALSINKKLVQYNNDNALNCLRTEIRKEALMNLKIKLDDDERVFTLTAPTGSGKTMMLLALANEIISRNPEHDILYALPYLSITEQVEMLAKDIFGGDMIIRIDSKSESKQIQELIENSDSEPEKLQELLRRNFSVETFDHPFIITTFVRFFETLVSNKNAELLKLPNFSKRIILIDEVQALPPRLYIFFAALLDEFCRRFDSYVIFSTATMPYLEIDEKTNNGKDARSLFKHYPKCGEAKKRELLNAHVYFKDEIFNRYKITRIEKDAFTLAEIAEAIKLEEESCLVILNTIKDTKDLYENFQKEPDVYILLNTHFHIEDRKKKIDYCKKRLKDGGRVVLISTQLIEAGVDIDFPVLYRDLCPLPSLIQSAGRCNRNGNSKKGRVYFFELKDDLRKKSRAELIYRDEVGRKFIKFCGENIKGEVEEKDLYDLQAKFFEETIKELNIGWHYQEGLKKGAEKIEILDCIMNARFETLGQFKLISEKEYGEEYSYYIPNDVNDNAFEKLSLFKKRFEKEMSFEELKKAKIDLTEQLRSMSERVVTIHLHESNINLAPQATEAIYGIMKLTQKDGYSSQKGILLNRIKNTFI